MQLRPEGGISNIYNNMSRRKRLENNMKVLAVFSFHRSLKFSYFVPRDLVIQLLMIYLDVGHSAFYVRGQAKKTESKAPGRKSFPRHTAVSVHSSRLKHKRTNKRGEHLDMSSALQNFHSSSQEQEGS